MFKRYLLTAAIAAALTACGGGGGSSNSSSGNPSNPAAPTAPSNQITVTGTATAPGATVALLRQQNLFEVAMNMLIPPAAAAVIGLEPVTGATVELIRVDNTGAQVGEVLASTATSLTGDYTLTLPTGVDLSGDLIVRITGATGVEMRAQVVDRAVNISPVSEFVLRKFIASGTDLKTIAEGDVVKLSGKVEEFDLTATGDMSSMLAKLEAEVGVFIDNQIDTITSTEGDASTINGTYRSSAFDIDLHDSDGSGHGTFALDLYNAEFDFSGSADGSVNITFKGEEAAWASLSGADPASSSLNYHVDIDDETETFTAALGSDNVLTIETPFEEEIDGDWGWRWAPAILRLQQVRDHNILFLSANEGSVRYSTVDTNSDGIKDAVDPAQREGDEQSRSIEVFFKSPTNMLNADLDGTFGRVYLSASLHAPGGIYIESEVNELTFDGDNSTVDSGAVQRLELTRTGSGPSVFNETPVAADVGMPFLVNADGDIDTIDGEPADGFVNDTADFIAFTESEGTDGSDARSSVTWAVKLPTSQLSVTGKTYRLMQLNTVLRNQVIAVGTTRIRSTVTWNSETAGTAKLESDTIMKIGLQGEVVPSSGSGAEIPMAIHVAANGYTQIEYPGANGNTLHLDGYLNETGSYGIFQSRLALPDGGETIALGMAVLIEVPAAE